MQFYLDGYRFGDPDVLPAAPGWAWSMAGRPRRSTGSTAQVPREGGYLVRDDVDLGRSAFGRAMEVADRELVSRAVCPAALAARGRLSDAMLDNVIAASAGGDAFPTNLGRGQPVDATAPETQCQIVRATRARRAPREELAPRLADRTRRTLTH